MFSISAAVVITMYVPILLHSETRLCVIWPEEDTFRTYPHQILIPSQETWSAVYYKMLHVSLV